MGTATAARATPPIPRPNERILMKPVKVLASAALASSAAALLVLGSAGAASAEHTHVKVVGNGGCVVMAEGAGEARVHLPSAVFAGNPNVDIAETAGRAHPLHVLVHQGRPGENMELHVLGSSAEAGACEGHYLNR